MQDSPLSWIIFDAVGTLIQPHPPVAVAYWQVGRRYGSRLSLTEVDRRFREAFGRSEGDLETSETREREFWRRTVGRVFTDVANRDLCFEELFDHFGQPTAWRCFPDAEPTVRELAARGYRLGIASNFDERLRGVLNGLPIGRLLELYAVSSTIGFRKPSPRFFNAVAESVETSPAEILYVGDDPHNDVAAARAAGMAAMQIDRESSESSPVLLRDLRELLDVLPSCPNGSPSNETPPPAPAPGPPW